METEGAYDELLVVYFGVNPWRGIKQRPQHLAEGLAIRNRVIYVNPIPPGVPRSIQMRLKESASEWSMITSKIERLWVTGEKVNKNLLVLDVRGLPGTYISPRLHDAQMKLLSLFLLKKLGRGRSYPDVLWLSHPRQATVARQISSNTVICYDCMDDYPRMARKSQRERMVGAEGEILSRADVVFASSRALEEKCQSVARNVVRVPNAASFEHFARPDRGSSGERRRTSEPLLGYFGWIDRWTDLQLVSDVASARPTWRIQLIGPQKNPRCRELVQMPNVELVGEVSYENLPEYAEKFDVCIMPFTMDDLSVSINPVKMYEYLATGKPVVSTDLPEVRELTPLIRVAKNSSEFISEVENALKEIDPDLNARRRELARLNNWERRIRTIQTEIWKSHQEKAAE